MIKRNSFTVKEALEALKKYCAYQERCHQDVLNKLKSMGMIPEAIDQIVVELIGLGYLNESRFAKTFVSGKFRIKKWGRKRLISELQKRGLSKFTINEAINEISEAEYIEVFNALAEKRLEMIQADQKFTRKKKLANYLLYRGWESALVYDKVHELIR
ncbi:MAG: RecX family transcriptional regulator [Flavobacteriaceae bacterium]|nr:RecX family transcriptional regulator [Bacteroidia bacterium]NNF74059.1 RecX family transcriptional regulator [Flavobacteriaceae bacterium]NNK73583.1 RecX family transcriptional regulator [Flavobacteriaceae bacterium]